MKEVTLIFPDQLFKNHPSLEKKRPVLLAEEYLYFKVQPFHKQKLVLLRASMKVYESFLKKKGFEVIYIESHLLNKRGELFRLMTGKGVETIHLGFFADEWLRQDLEKAKRKFNWNLHYSQSPMFLCEEDEIRSFFKGKKHFSMAQFYVYQRKKLNILMKENSPIGGKFSFDTENRKKLPKKIEIPPPFIPKQNKEIPKSIAYVEKEFPKAIGEGKPFHYPVTFKEAESALADFIKHRLPLFGDYEDAIQMDGSFLFHSVLSSSLNIGLLTPTQIVDAVLSSSKSIPIASLEGFLRQIIGWREFMRACYLLKGNAERTSNFFKHKSRLPKGFWDGTTGILPVDATIRKVLKTGYCHHIERLMILGNFLLLTETDPDAVYEWFMGYFVDAYDWVMVPNVYGMSQFSDEGSITTKPYISGSNYILKMSDYPKGDWVDLWDGLFWRFLSKHKPLFSRNPRTKVLLSLLVKNSKSIQPKISAAEQWLKKQKNG